ncbi:Cytochrome P450 4C1 [Orchesella cincta]|uniref:Cytochrome P450 4C1 n=1 Tax=Orchesella cincta TaxID=48709 RepID=A0A1D2ML97_ORCCI|nr:Cytochrome P450 4C1 [Orchesella cincta]
MGRKVFVQQKSDSEYVKAIYRLSELVQYRQLRPWLHPGFLWRLSPAGRENEECLKILHGFTDLVIRERKQERLEMMKEPSKEKETKEDDGVYMSWRKSKAGVFRHWLLMAQADRGRETGLGRALRIVWPVIGKKADKVRTSLDEEVCSFCKGPYCVLDVWHLAFFIGSGQRHWIGEKARAL